MRKNDLRRRERVPVLAMGTALAAAVVGVAIVLHVRGWSALSSESGGGCSADCPQGLPAVLVLAFVCTFVGLPALMLLAGAFWEQVDARGMLGGRWTAVVGVVGLLAGLWPGVLVYDGLRGHILDVRWSAPLDRPSGVVGVGSWVHDNLVVRARVDRLTAYADQRIGWTMEIPGRDALCAMSRDVEDGVGLVAWAADNRPCATVAAIDLRTGKSLWQRNRSAADRYVATATSDELAVAAGVAVFTEPTGLRAVGLRENDERWRLDVEEGCTPTDVAASDDRVTVLVYCGDEVVDLLAVDPRTGREHWRTRLPVQPPLTEVTLLAADPVVVHAVEAGSRPEDVFIAFSDEGQVRARIPRSGPDYDISVADQFAFGSWLARPVRRVTVWDDRLIAPVGVPGEDELTAVAAFSLETGAQLWRTSVDGDVAAVEQTADGPVVATEDLLLYELSPADGAVVASTPVRGDWFLFGFDLRKVKDMYAVIAYDGTRNPPVTMIG